MEETNRGGEKKKRLTLRPYLEGVKIGNKSDGKVYMVRDDRSRYFFPEEWIRFFDATKSEKQGIFDVLINTGARIEEALNIKPEDFDWERNNLTLKVTKIKAAKKETIGRRRTFVISSQFAKRMKAYINRHKIKEGNVLFPISKQGVSQMLKRTLKRIGIKDWYMFSLHNIRKTHGNWLNALEVSPQEICMRLGHDMNTYLKHYGSANIFDRKDKVIMIKILGDAYGFK
jgi:integrase